MRLYSPEDTHGAGHYYYLVIIRKSSEHFTPPVTRQFGANGQLLAQTYEHLYCDIPINEYPTYAWVDRTDRAK